MNSFSVKNSLYKLKAKNYDINITKTINTITENLEEDQIRVISQYQGLKIDNNIIRLHFIENIGFRCYNEKDNIIGKLPVCKNIEKYMNELYIEYIKSTHI